MSLVLPRESPETMLWLESRFALAFLFGIAATRSDSELTSHVLHTFNATSDVLGFPFLSGVGDRAAQSHNLVLDINIDGRVP